MKKTNPDGRDGRADIHVHTRYSGYTNYSFLHFPDSVTHPARAADAARRKKLDVLCITDHNTIRGAMIAKSCAKDIDIIIGEEVSSADGEILALSIQEEIKPGKSAADTIDCIHEQDGVAIAAHPFSAQCPALGAKTGGLALDGVEAFNAYHRDAYSNFMAQNFLPKKFAMLGGSDAHTAGMIGNEYTVFEGRTAEEFRKSIMRGKVSFGGSRTPLWDCMSWSRESATEIFKMSHSSLKGEKNDDVLYSRMDAIQKKTKAIGLIGAGMYVGLQLSLLAGILGELVLNIKSRRNWNHMQQSMVTE